MVVPNVDNCVIGHVVEAEIIVFDSAVKFVAGNSGGRQVVLVCPNTKFNSVIIAVFNTGKGVVGDDCLADIQLNRIADKTVIIIGCFRGESAIVKCELTGSINDKFCFVAKSEILNGDVITGNGDRTIRVGGTGAVKHVVFTGNSEITGVALRKRYSSNGLSFFVALRIRLIIICQRGGGQ